MIKTSTFKIETEGNTDIIDITDRVQILIKKSNLKQGSALIFVSGSTAGLTTVEYEPGLVKDIEEFFNSIIPENRNYHHNEKWHDGNGHSHIRASLLKPSITIPFQNSKLILGTWQQIILIDFDTRPRTREITLQLNGE